MDKISELTIRQGNVNVEGVIIEFGEINTFNKFGKELRVVNVVLEDGSGKIKLSLWNDDVNNFKVGDKVKITNGYVNEFQSEKQLTAGKFGKIEKSEEKEPESEEPEENEDLEEIEKDFEEPTEEVTEKKPKRKKKKK